MASLADAEKLCGLSLDDVMNITKNNETPLEKEAGEIWKQLDHLAATDPKEYKRYIKQQLDEGKEYFDENGKLKEEKKPKPNVPKSVFWVETEVLDSSGKSLSPKIPRYFNVCESTSIEYTDDKNLNIYMSDLDNRQIDCVIHPNFMAKCTDDNLFMHDTVQLLFKTYTAEHKERETVRSQYKHHDEPRKLVMKVPKLPSQQEKEAKSAMDILSKVRHSEDAKKLVQDEREELTKRLFEMYNGGAAAKPEKPSAPDPETTFAKAPAAKKPNIVEIKPALNYTSTVDADSVVVRVTFPPSVAAADIDLELEDDKALVVTTPSCLPLTIPLERTAADYSAKFIKGKNQLKITLKQ